MNYEIFDAKNTVFRCMFQPEQSVFCRYLIYSRDERENFSPNRYFSASNFTEHFEKIQSDHKFKR